MLNCLKITINKDEFLPQELCSKLLFAAFYWDNSFFSPLYTCCLFVLCSLKLDAALKKTMVQPGPTENME